MAEDEARIAKLRRLLARLNNNQHASNREMRKALPKEPRRAVRRLCDLPAPCVAVTGETRANVTGKGYARHFCPSCGSPVFAIEENRNEIELYSGSFDEISIFPPTYELWTVRREDWLGPMPTLERHFERDRPTIDESGTLTG